MLLNTADYISKRLEFVLVKEEMQFRDYVRVNLELMRTKLGVPPAYPSCWGLEVPKANRRC